jgi:Family of unknown function (DUF6545)
MGKALLYAAPPILLWTAVVSKLPALRRRPNDPVLRAYFSAMLTLAAAVTVIIPPVQVAIDRTTGVTDLALLLRHTLALGCACAAQAFLLYSSYPQAEADPKVRRQVWALVGTLLAMAALFLVGQAQDEGFDLLGHHGNSPTVLLYWLLWLGYLGAALVNAARLLRRWARLTDQVLLRPGLRLIAAGAAVGLGYVGYHLVLLATSQLGWPPQQRLSDQQLIIQGLTIASQVLLVAGLTLPAWGPRVGLPKLLRWVDHYCGLWRLYPLWRVLCEAFPGVALEPPTGVWRDRRRLRGLEFRLHRRVGEMRDVQLRLRPYLDSRVAEAAATLGHNAGLEGEELGAVVEAASLAAALDAKVHHQLRAGPVATGLTGGDHGSSVGADLSSEVARLTRVAQAFTGSPLVAAAARDRSRTTRPTAR